MKLFTKRVALSALLILLSQHVFAKEELVFAVDLIRHGDRTPIHEVPHPSHVWTEGTGALTSIGLNQAFRLGKILRKRYIIDRPLLSPSYQAGTLFVRSTDVDRTLMTATAILYGLYPLGTGPKLPFSHESALPQGFQPIPIHTKSLQTDQLLRVGSQELMSFYEGQCVKHLASLKEKLNKWQVLTAIPLKSCKEVIELGDTLKVRQIHHVALPAGLTKKDADEIIQLSDQLMVDAYKNDRGHHTAGRLFLRRLAHDLQQAQAKQSTLKYELFLAHDSTILSVMSALGMPLVRPPAYIADLNFLLLKDNKHNDMVKVLYNGLPVKLPRCEKACALEQFVKLFA